MYCVRRSVSVWECWLRERCDIVLCFVFFIVPELKLMPEFESRAVSLRCWLWRDGMCVARRQDPLNVWLANLDTYSPEITRRWESSNVRRDLRAQDKTLDANLRYGIQNDFRKATQQKREVEIYSRKRKPRWERVENTCWAALSSGLPSYLKPVTTANFISRNLTAYRNKEISVFNFCRGCITI